MTTTKRETTKAVTEGSIPLIGRGRHGTGYQFHRQENASPGWVSIRGPLSSIETNNVRTFGAKRAQTQRAYQVNISVKFDDRDLQRAFTEYMAYTKKSAQESLQKQIVQLAVGAKGVKGLFQEALATRKETVRDIRSLPARLNYAIRRAPGFSVRQEIARRVQSAGYYQASGWIVPGIAEPRGRGATVKTLRGSIKTTGGINPRVSISNSSPKAFEFGSKTGYIQRALDARARDMLKYVKNKMAREAREFSKAKPNFNIPLSTLESLMSLV